MYTAKFIGGYMDGEVMALPQPYPQYRFARALPVRVVHDTTPIESTHIWDETYELDGREGEVLFSRHSKVDKLVRRYYNG